MGHTKTAGTKVRRASVSPVSRHDMEPAMQEARRMIGALVDCPYEGAIMAQTHLVCQCCGTHVYGPQRRDHLKGDRVTVLGLQNGWDRQGRPSAILHGQDCILVQILPDGAGGEKYLIEGPGYPDTDRGQQPVLTCAYIYPNQTRAARPGMTQLRGPIDAVQPGQGFAPSGAPYDGPDELDKPSPFIEVLGDLEGDGPETYRAYLNQFEAAVTAQTPSICSSGHPGGGQYCGICNGTETAEGKRL